MPLKFRLKGLAETFVDQVKCPCCGLDGGEEAEDSFETHFTRVTFDGIVVVVECLFCGHVFLPEGQKLGIINHQRLRDAVEQDSIENGQPIYTDRNAVVLEVEKLNAERSLQVH